MKKALTFSMTFFGAFFFASIGDAGRYNNTPGAIGGFVFGLMFINFIFTIRDYLELLIKRECRLRSKEMDEFHEKRIQDAGDRESF